MKVKVKSNKSKKLTEASLGQSVADAEKKLSAGKNNVEVVDDIDEVTEEAKTEIDEAFL